MPATVVLEHHEPKPHPQGEAALCLPEFFLRSCPYEYSVKSVLHASSFGDSSSARSTNLHPSSASFVRSAIEAWGRHSHLVLRPDDFWFQILVQMNFFMTRNGEALRHLFVSHEGEKVLKVEDVNRWDAIIEQFGEDLRNNVKTPWLADWVDPGFTTSTCDDKLTATVLMMGLMKTYFKYLSDETCGIPSVTLLGTKEDWERLMSKVERLDDFGTEPADYRRRLQPLLQRIARTFDDPSSSETKDFWDQMVHAKVKHDNMCGAPPLQYVVSGWILGFFYWNSSGRPDQRFSRGVNAMYGPGPLVYDDIQYGEASLDDLPVGYATVPVTSCDQGWTGWLLAGGIGKTITKGVPDAHPDGHHNNVNTQKRASIADSADDRESYARAGCWSGFLSGLPCFGHKSTSERKRKQRSGTHSFDEKQSASSLGMTDDKHSTIQPQSGWVLFSPKIDLGPFIEDEVYGPTTDAIDSCANVEHYHARGNIDPRPVKSDEHKFELSFRLK